MSEQPPQESLANVDVNEEGDVGADGSGASPEPPSPQQAQAASTDSSYDEDATGGDPLVAEHDGFSPLEATQSGESGYTSEAGSGGEGAFGVEAEESDAGNLGE